MIRDLKPYPAYKDSGVPWLGKVPEHWLIERLKSVISNVIQMTGEPQNGESYVALEHVESWTGRVRQADPEVFFDSQVKRFQSGDVLFGKLRPYLAKVTRLTSDGVCVGEFFVLRPCVSNITAPYIEQLLRSKPVIDVINSSTFGAKMPRVDWQFMGGMMIPLPPLPEQTAIVRFLDHIDRRIRRSIRAKQKLIKLLEEQKQAIINLAVTRGLDSNARLKPSGVEWLGEVPEHWAIKKLKTISPRISGRLVYSPAQYFCESGVPFLFGTNITESGFSFEKVKFIPHEINERFKHHTLREGDLVMVRVGAPGLTTVVPIEADGLNCASMMIIRKDPGFNSKWLAYVLNSRIGQMQVDIATYGAAQVQINISDAVNFLIPTPPLNEQNQIADYIDRQISKILSIVPSINTGVKFLREYRTRLIADVVTGKVDVRHIPLPDESNIETIFGEDIESLDNETCALDEVECAVEIEE